jgi:hypothetical protein
MAETEEFTYGLALLVSVPSHRHSRRTSRVSATLFDANERLRNAGPWAHDVKPTPVIEGHIIALP